MSFNSFDFLIFFPIVILIYFLLNNRFRWILLLAASYFFYASSSGKLLILIIISTLVDYFAGLKMGDLPSKKERRPYLIVSLLINLGILSFFKYYNFFNDSFSLLFSALHLNYLIPSLDIILPVGISFYTLQTIGYSIDVYRGDIKSEKHLGYFALYVCYFPQLVAGPIEKAAHLLPQFKLKHDFESKRVLMGLKLIAFGLFKKVVIADRIYPMVQFLTNNPDEFNGLSILLCSCLFSYQVYCDFSGYSDIAIGCAQVMGVNLMENFKRPFHAKSLSELWKRWHISLYLWFKDYLYVPIVKRGPKSNLRTIFAILAVFLISGLWHGAAWIFIFWGVSNAIVIIISKLINEKGWKFPLNSRTKNSFLYNYILRIKTFLIFAVLVTFLYSSDITTAFNLLSNLFSNWAEDIKSILSDGDARVKKLYLGYTLIEFSLVIFSIFILEAINSCQERFGSAREILLGKNIYVRWSLYTCLIFSIILFSFDNEFPFYYFQF